MPRVSVLLPVFDAGPHLQQALDSIRAQTFTDFEVLACDDGSSDGSWDLLQRTAGQDPRFLPRRGPHRGYTAWLDDGLDRAAGEFVARMDADDVCRPERFARQLAFLHANPSCACVGTQAMRIDDRGGPISPWTVPLSHDAIEQAHFAQQSSALIHPSIMFRRDAVRALGGYRPEFEPAEDFDLYLRLAERWQLANLPDELLLYRVHLRSVTVQRLGQQVECALRAVAEAWQRRGRDGPAPATRRQTAPPTPEQIEWSWVRAAFTAGNYATARHHAWQLLRRRPWQYRRWLLWAGACSGRAGKRLQSALGWRGFEPRA